MTVEVLDGEAAVRAGVGRRLGSSDWFEVTTDSVDRFLVATGAADSTYLALGLSNMLLPQIVEVRGFAMGINYGTGNVRFGTPLRPGDRVRGHADLIDVAAVRDGIQTTMRVVVEVEGTDEPACAIESLSRWLR